MPDYAGAGTNANRPRQRYLHHCAGQQHYYKDNGMGVEKISAYFEMILSQFSRYFNEEIGTNFRDYVQFFRHEEVKRHLRMSDMAVKDIVMEVGYTSVSKYIEKFTGQYSKSVEKDIK